MLLNIMIHKEEPILPWLYLKLGGEYVQVQDKNFAMIQVNGDEPYYSENSPSDVDAFLRKV